MDELVVWATFGVVQLGILGAAMLNVARMGEQGRQHGWLVLVVLGVLLAGANLAWVAAGHPLGGGSPIGLSGMLLPIWLAFVIGFEIALVALIALLRQRTG